jgi:hypothetical protein
MQFEKEEACRLSKRQPETEKTRADATADMSEDLFEGEKGEDAGDPSVAYGDSTTGSSPKTSSIDKLYIVLIRYRGYSFQIIFKYGAWKKCFFLFFLSAFEGALMFFCPNNCLNLMVFPVLVERQMNC